MFSTFCVTKHVSYVACRKSFNFNPSHLRFVQGKPSRMARITNRVSLSSQEDKTSGKAKNLPWEPDTWHQWWWEAANEEAVQVLLMMPEADVDARDGKGETKLLFAVAKGDSDMSRRLLEDGGADPNIASFKGTTPIIHAVWNKDAATLQMLVGAGADVNVRDSQIGYTLPMWAVENEDIDCLRILINTGADLSFIWHGTTIEGLAKTTGNQEVLQLLRDNVASS